MSESSFEWERVGSLLDRTLKLNKETTARFPVMKPDDDLAKMTRKIMNYVNKSTNVASLTDNEIAEMAGLRVADDEQFSWTMLSNVSIVKLNPARTQMCCAFDMAAVGEVMSNHLISELTKEES